MIPIPEIIAARHGMIRGREGFSIGSPAMAGLIGIPHFALGISRHGGFPIMSRYPPKPDYTFSSRDNPGNKR